MAVTIKSKEEIQCMRDAGKILAEVHEKLAEIIAPGITSLEIDRKGEELIRNAGCIPSFKGYEGYPASSCMPTARTLCWYSPTMRWCMVFHRKNIIYSMEIL